MFYSISNCQRGLAGVSFGHFLIKQVVEEISREFSRLGTFVTLSPVPGLAGWIARERGNEILVAPGGRPCPARRISIVPHGGASQAASEALREPFMRVAATYFLSVRAGNGAPFDSVARFHLSNGARLERLNWLADLSDKGLQQSYGLMVNYLYDRADIEKNHEAYAEGRAVVASSAVRKLARGSRDLVRA